MALFTGIALAVSAAVSLASAAIKARAAGKAAKTQATAAERAAELTHETATEALDWQKEMWNQIQGIQKPYLEAGEAGLNQLLWDMGLKSGDFKGNEADFGKLAKGFEEKFVAPTEADMMQEPGYAWRVKQGRDIIEGAAAAKGNLLTGGTAKALTRYGQDFASNEYSNVYNRSMQEYMNRFNISNIEDTNLYNRLSGVAGVGERAAGALTGAGLRSVEDRTQTAMLGTERENQYSQNAALARASGYLTGGNLWGGAVQNIGQLVATKGLDWWKQRNANKGWV